LASTTKLTINLSVAFAARAPTPLRWPRLEALGVFNFDLAALEARGSSVWASLRSLRIELPMHAGLELDVPAARALAAALRRMPALRALELRRVALSDAAAAELFRASSDEAALQLRALTIECAGLPRLAPAAARMIAATGWRLEELGLFYNRNLGAAGLAVLLAAPTFALRRLDLAGCGLDAAALLSLANAPWPLEELDLLANDFSGAAAGPALAAQLSARHAGLHKVHMNSCRLSAASFKALVEAAWPALTSLEAGHANVAFDGPYALGAAAFAGFPALEVLGLCDHRK
jgi:hypothetical protein